MKNTVSEIVQDRINITVFEVFGNPERTKIPFGIKILKFVKIFKGLIAYEGSILFGVEADFKSLFKIIGRILIRKKDFDFGTVIILTAATNKQTQ